jgi:hypothetical protein
MMRRVGFLKVGIDLPDALVGLMSGGGAHLHCRTCRGARASLMVADMLLIGSQRCWFLSSVFLMVGGIVVDAEMMSLGGIVVDAGLPQCQRGESAGEVDVRAGLSPQHAGGHSARH